MNRTKFSIKLSNQIEKKKNLEAPEILFVGQFLA